MKSSLPRSLGVEFWVGFLVIPISLFFAWVGYSNGSGRNFLGSVLVATIFLWKMIDQFRRVRLAKLLDQNPKVRDSYHSVER
ncbi:hypothetical protein S2M10_29860 [Sphingomonas sp. S2M10]|uniref:hypothetical protein n=1 Tax=Sphingomonas sp. S2M10 TaxID=2705010 RepID=UPI0014564D37|nr:hypothetical protein [Sphingomonas sp. S2M10]NLS27983.1 hypothetical protein [Sphingomonas sp. S2M10]